MPPCLSQHSAAVFVTLSIDIIKELPDLAAGRALNHGDSPPQFTLLPAHRPVALRLKPFNRALSAASPPSNTA